MAGQGLIGLEAAIALALGANIGTCVTAGLASIGKPREAVRTAPLPPGLLLIGAQPKAIEQTFDQLATEMNSILDEIRS